VICIYIYIFINQLIILLFIRILCCLNIFYKIYASVEGATGIDEAAFAANNAACCCCCLRAADSLRVTASCKLSIRTCTRFIVYDIESNLLRNNSIFFIYGPTIVLLNEEGSEADDDDEEDAELVGAVLCTAANSIYIINESNCIKPK